MVNPRNAWAVGLSATAALIFACTTAMAEQVIGTADRVSVWAYQTPEGAARTDLFDHDRITLNALIEAAPDGEVELAIKDGTRLYVGPSSQIKLDEFVYKEEGSLSLRHVSGALRFVSGGMRPSNYKIKTNVATVGIRGTNILIWDGDASDDFLHVVSGSVAITPVNATTATNVVAGQTAKITETSVEIVAAGAAPATPQLGGSFDQPGDLDDSPNDVSEDPSDEDEPSQGSSEPPGGTGSSPGGIGAEL